MTFPWLKLDLCFYYKWSVCVVIFKYCFAKNHCDSSFEFLTPFVKESIGGRQYPKIFYPSRYRNETALSVTSEMNIREAG